MTATGCIPPSSRYPHVPGSGTTDGEPDARTSDVGPQTDACVVSEGALCEAQGVECGELSATDACGASRTVNCGECLDGGICDSNSRVCCVPGTDIDFCEAYDAECGDLEALDNCGAVRVANCGTCTAGIDCNGTTCGQCVPESDVEFCARLGVECGVLESGADNCGDVRLGRACGSCVDGKECVDPDGDGGPQTARCTCPGGFRESVCGDDVDNDCDGKVDCEDEDCDGLVCRDVLMITTRCANMRCPL